LWKIRIGTWGFRVDHTKIKPSNWNLIELTICDPITHEKSINIKIILGGLKRQKKRKEN